MQNAEWLISVYRVAVLVLLTVCLALGICIVRLRRFIKQLETENGNLRDQLEDAIKRLAQLDQEPKSKSFNKLVNLLVSAGVPGLIFVGAVSVSGFYGAAAITTVLAGFGGPWGMMAGVGTLILLTAVLSQCDILDIARAVLAKLLKTKSKAEIRQEIDALGFIPGRFRAGTKALLETV